MVLLIYTDRRTDPLLIGDENPALLIVTAENHGEGAYETELYVQLPPQTHYHGVLSDEEVRAVSLIAEVYLAIHIINGRKYTHREMFYLTFALRSGSYKYLTSVPQFSWFKIVNFVICDL